MVIRFGARDCDHNFTTLAFILADSLLHRYFYMVSIDHLRCD